MLCDPLTSAASAGLPRSTTSSVACSRRWQMTPCSSGRGDDNRERVATEPCSPWRRTGRWSSARTPQMRQELSCCSGCLAALPAAYAALCHEVARATAILAQDHRARPAAPGRRGRGRQHGGRHRAQPRPSSPPPTGSSTSDRRGGNDGGAIVAEDTSETVAAHHAATSDQPHGALSEGTAGRTSRSKLPPAPACHRSRRQTEVPVSTEAKRAPRERAFRQRAIPEAAALLPVLELGIRASCTDATPTITTGGSGAAGQLGIDRFGTPAAGGHPRRARRRAPGASHPVSCALRCSAYFSARSRRRLATSRSSPTTACSNCWRSSSRSRTSTLSRAMLCSMDVSSRGCSPRPLTPSSCARANGCWSPPRRMTLPSASDPSTQSPSASALSGRRKVAPAE